MSLFNNRKSDTWTQLAEMIEAEFIKGGFWKSDKVVSNYKNWTIILDTYTHFPLKSSVTYTRVRAPLISTGDLSFKLYNKNIMSGIGKLLGLTDISIGDTNFENKYTIKGNNEEKITELFSNSKVQELIYSIEKVHLEIKDDEGWFNRYEYGEDLLYFHTVGVIKDINKLRDIFFLFYLVLELLVILDSASMEKPVSEMK